MPQPCSRRREEADFSPESHAFPPHALRKPWKGKRIVLLLLAGLLLILAVLRWFEHTQVYHPDRVLTATGAELGRPCEDVSFESKDGTKLHGWFFPGQTNSPRSNLAILGCHGNAGNISHR